MNEQHVTIFRSYLNTSPHPTALTPTALARHQADGSSRKRNPHHVALLYIVTTMFVPTNVPRQPVNIAGCLDSDVQAVDARFVGGTRS